MAKVTLKGNPVNTAGELPKVGSNAPDFNLVKVDLSEISLADFSGSKLILNIFPSVDTGVCASSIRTFNKKASELDNTKILCVSADLPFAAARFCGAEGIDNVTTGSSFRSQFGQDYGVVFSDGPLAGLLSRSVVVIDEQGKVIYTEQVAETTEEPDYEAALKVL